MKTQEFINKWNVAFESKEQELEFAKEMESDLNKLLKRDPPSEEEIERMYKDWKSNLSFNKHLDVAFKRVFDYALKTGVYYRDTTLESQVAELLGLTGCKNVGEVVEKWKGDTTYKYKCRLDAITIQELSKPIGRPQDEMTRTMFDLLDMVFKLTN